MPLDLIPFLAQHDFKDRAVWYVKFAWIPKRCAISKKLIWLEKAYKGTAMWTGPGAPIFEHRWVAVPDFLLARLKGQL